jgi:selT/selW/selH-like putative selenoprotein
LAATIQRERSLTATLVPGGGGEFEVTLDGTLVFSKRREHRFPEDQEILSRIPV